MKQICRFCTNYRPDERYRGVVGFCDKYDEPKSVKDTCYDFEKGEQRWMNGEVVEEDD